jgi:hypothetical protein
LEWTYCFFKKRRGYCVEAFDISLEDVVI